jgi:glycosyltransferase involved in cell wall biosynthesis
MSYTENDNIYKLTIAVLTYNRANYLKEMLDSILQQTYKDFFVVIYDNCSEDNTSEIVKPYLSDKRFTYYRHAVSVGRENINYAFKNCMTDYLLIVHDDDIMLPDMAKREISIMDSYDDISLVWTNMNYIDINSNITKLSSYSNKMNDNDFIVNSKEYINIILDKDNVIACPTVMFRMSIIKANNLSFRVDIGGASDLYFWLEINQLNYKFYYINTALYNYRIHNLQESNNSLLLFPFLRIPIYNLLVKNKYSKHIINSWLKKVENDTIKTILRQQDKRKAFKTIKNEILFHDKRDLVFLVKIYYISYLHGFILYIININNKVLNKIKKIIPYNTKLFLKRIFLKKVNKYDKKNIY